MPRRYLPIVAVVAGLVSSGAAWVGFEPVDPAAGYRIVRVAVSADGRWIAVASASGWVGIIDQEMPEGPQRFRAGQGELRDLRFSADEEWVFVRTDECSRHSVFQLGSLEACNGEGEPQVSAGWAGEHSSNVVTAAGEIVFGNAAGSIEVHDAASGAMLRRFTFR